MIFTIAATLLGAPPVFIDERPEIPWIVMTSPGSSCGAYRRVEGPKAQKEALQKQLEKSPEIRADTLKKAEQTQKRLPLLYSPGLWGLEGEVLLVAAEKITKAPAKLVIDASGAWLDVAAEVAEAEATLAPSDLQAIVELAKSRLARKRSLIGTQAQEQAQRQSCPSASPSDPALPLELARRLRTRLSAPSTQR